LAQAAEITSATGCKIVLLEMREGSEVKMTQVVSVA
jgi:hypothetical protein